MNWLEKIFVTLLALSGISIAYILLKEKDEKGKKNKVSSSELEENKSEEYLSYNELMELLKNKLTSLNIPYDETAGIDSLISFGEENFKKAVLNILNSSEDTLKKAREIVKIYENPQEFLPPLDFSITLPKPIDSIPIVLKTYFDEYKIYEVSPENLSLKLEELLNKIYERGIKRAKAKIKVEMEYLKQLLEEPTPNIDKIKEILESIKQEMAETSKSEEKPNLEKNPEK
jgi:hypothetical protein